MSILDTVKKAAKQTGETGMPAAFWFGTVKGTSPLTIRVDNRFDIQGEAIVLMKEFVEGSYRTHKHPLSPHAHAFEMNVGEGERVEGLTEETELETDEELYEGLKTGEKLVLLRNQGGQSFLVLGRV